MAWTQFRQAKSLSIFIRLIMLTITITSGMQDMKEENSAMTSFEMTLVIARSWIEMTLYDKQETERRQ